MRREVDPDVYCPQAALIDEETNRRAEARLARYRARHEAEKLHRRQMMAAAQQRRRMWTAGGALALAAAGWLWYRLYVRKRRAARKATVGGDLPRDLFLDEDDANVTEEELEQLFHEAAKVARSFPEGMLDQRDQLMLYGLYKQAKEGDLHGKAPSKLNVVAHAKYDSWGKFKGLPKRFAIKKYCEVVYHFSNGGESSYSDAKGRDENADVHYRDDDKQGDVDEDGCPIGEDGADDAGGEMVSGMGMRQSTLAGTRDDAKSQPASTANSTQEVRLREAAIADDSKLLAEIMEGACDVDAADEHGLTALHFAADRGSADCLKLLLEGGADVNATDRDGIGVLQTALSAGADVGLLQMLLEAGADPDARDEDGDSPRAQASEEGDEDVMALFALFPGR